MKKILLAVMLSAFASYGTVANAAIIGNLGVNPSSAQGDFSNSVGGAANFQDQWTFQLVGAPTFITIASVTNVFPAPTDKISNFTAAVWTTGANGIVNDFDDVVVIGPVAATQGCGPIVNCQFAAGTALLSAGAYYLEFTGSGGGTSGYGGNLSTRGVPGPAIGAGLPGLIAACGGLIALARRRRKQTV